VFDSRFDFFVLRGVFAPEIQFIVPIHDPFVQIFCFIVFGGSFHGLQSYTFPDSLQANSFKIAKKLIPIRMFSNPQKMDWFLIGQK
jgi:hypothetical protein